MAVEDRWHYASLETAQEAGVSARCDCKGKHKGYPTGDHGRGKQWRVRWRENGRPRAKSFAVKTGRDGADAFDAAQRTQQAQGIPAFDPTRGNVTFSAYAEALIRARYRDPNSRRTQMGRYNRHLKPFFGDMRMLDTAIQTSTVTEWLAWMRRRPKAYGGGLLSENTVEQCWVLLVTIMKTAVEVDEIRLRNPCQGVVRPKRVRHQPTPDEIWEQGVVDRLLELIDDYNHGIALLAATCGLRQGEAFAVAAGDIVALRNKLTVRHQVGVDDKGQLCLKAPKGNKVRTLTLPDVTTQALAAHIERYGTTPIRCTCCNREHQLLFTHKGGLLRNVEWNERVWHPVIEAAGLAGENDTGLHQLRHFYASMLHDRGVPVKAVSQALGHASVTVTLEIYTHVLASGEDKIRNAVDAAFTPRPATIEKAQGD